MCLIEDPEGRILVQNRLDPLWPGLCLPGGHVELGESFTAAVKREVLEETGLLLSKVALRGVKQFQTNQGERYLVLLYYSNAFTGTLCSSAEGPVFWLKKEELTLHKTVDDLFPVLQVIEEDNKSELFYQVNDSDWQIQLF